MGEELSESDLKRVKELEPQTSKQQVSTENVESPESEEMMNDGLKKAIKDEASSSVPSNESLVSEDLESTNSSSDEASDSKNNSTIVKGDTPASTTEPEMGSNSPLDSGQETPIDNQEMRPNTVSSRSLKMSRLRDVGKKFFEDCPNKIREMFNSVLPRKEYSTDSSGATSSFYGEGSTGEVQTLQPPLQVRTPLHVEDASQQGASGSATAFGSSIEKTTPSENGSVFSLRKGGNLLSNQGSKVSNGKASKGEISNFKDDQSSPTKKAKLQIEIEAKGDESTDSSSSKEEVNISFEKEDNQKTGSGTKDADMHEE